MDPSTLASGSQDGIMKFFDLRSFEMVAQVPTVQIACNAFFFVADSAGK
jgi:hypothetical protein